jgi:hypothetical protein
MASSPREWYIRAHHFHVMECRGVTPVASRRSVRTGTFGEARGLSVFPLFRSHILSISYSFIATQLFLVKYGTEAESMRKWG